MPLLEVELGPAFWVHTAYSYLLLVLGTGILGIGFFRSSRIYQRQMGIVFVGAMIPLITKGNNRLEVHISSEVDTIKVDELKLRQILLNLLSNAAKFTENGRISLNIFSQPTPISTENGHPLPKLVFQVRDTGIGLSDEQIETLFEPFIQAKAPHSPFISPGSVVLHPRKFVLDYRTRINFLKNPCSFLICENIAF